MARAIASAAFKATNEGTSAGPSSCRGPLLRPKAEGKCLPESTSAHKLP